ncbi:MAG: D-glycero-beta-D-manno-heptose 1,7-bisphosphate 7-phosphatase [Victivallaceae bacterium]|nr:D-glycero-beta-D-manno-heptose 1,7-bisphosphate 7-phosphatase [Victivallaceae bacterium]MDD4180994.1 D-glycero-beta-D-manno-heptose 1,7-bisphosphate 7-phosphatase [Victivallaceae bacterium]
MNKACFLDRDGVINEEVNYLHEPDKTIIMPGTAEALKLLKSHGFIAVVVTNQAGVARGYYEETDIHAVHQRIEELLAAEGAALDDFFYCPHHEKFTGECKCRKPNPGMLLKAIAKHNIDPTQSFMVGDRLTDLEAGHSAGCSRNYLVNTGYGAQAKVQDNIPSYVTIADDLLSAVKDFLDQTHDNQD